MTDEAELNSAARDYLAAWEARSNVRARGRYRMSPASEPELLQFPSPLFQEGEIVALPEDAQRYLRAQILYRFQNEIALLETDVTGVLAAALANRHRRIALPWSVRQVALTIDVDERYHAFVAREFIEMAAQASGIAPTSLADELPALGAVEQACAAAPADLRVDIETVLLCLVENAVTAELFGLHRQSPPTAPFFRVIGEHLVDEGRHAAFFRRLLAHYWPRLDEAERVAVGKVLPVFLGTFFGTNHVAIAAATGWLLELGLTKERARALAPRCIWRPAPADNLMWKSMRSAMERAGLLDHAPTRAALSAAGWLPG